MLFTVICHNKSPSVSLYSSTLQMTIDQSDFTQLDSQTSSYRELNTYRHQQQTKKLFNRGPDLQNILRFIIRLS